VCSVTQGELLVNFNYPVTVQERLTKQIAAAMMEAVKPAGVAVVIEAA
jgi:GTP cyclohydrolase I